MHPILFEIFNLEVSSWYFFFAASIISSYFLFILLVKQHAPGFLAEVEALFLVVYISGFLGARIASLLFEDSNLDFKESIFSLLELGSMTLYGGLIFGCLSGVAFVKLRKFSINKIADIATPTILLGISVGRIGCLLNGDDYGLPVRDQTNPPLWALKMTSMGDDVYRYPVQLIEALVCFALFTFTWKKLSKRDGSHGEVWRKGLLFYAVSRFLIEYIRGDVRGFFLVSFFSPAQSLSLLMILLIILSDIFFRNDNRSLSKK